MKVNELILKTTKLIILSNRYGVPSPDNLLNCFDEIYPDKKMKKHLNIYKKKWATQLNSYKNEKMPDHYTSEDYIRAIIPIVFISMDGLDIYLAPSYIDEKLNRYLKVPIDYSEETLNRISNNNSLHHMIDKPVRKYMREIFNKWYKIQKIIRD